MPTGSLWFGVVGRHSTFFDSLVRKPPRSLRRSLSPRSVSLDKPVIWVWGVGVAKEAGENSGVVIIVHVALDQRNVKPPVRWENAPKPWLMVRTWTSSFGVFHQPYTKMWRWDMLSSVLKTDSNLNPRRGRQKLTQFCFWKMFGTFVWLIFCEPTIRKTALDSACAQINTSPFL